MNPRRSSVPVAARLCCPGASRPPPWRWPRAVARGLASPLVAARPCRRLPLRGWLCPRWQSPGGVVVRPLFRAAGRRCFRRLLFFASSPPWRLPASSVSCCAGRGGSLVGPLLGFAALRPRSVVPGVFALCVRVCPAAALAVAFSLASLPSLPAPLGLRGMRVASGLWRCRASAPATVPGFGAAIPLPCAPGARIGSAARSSENPSLLDFVLDCGGALCYSRPAWPVPLLRGLPFHWGHPWTAKDRSTERPGGFFMPGRFLLPGLFRCSDSGEVNRQTGPPVSVFSASEQSQNCQPLFFSLLRERPIAGALDTRVPGG